MSTIDEILKLQRQAKKYRKEFAKADRKSDNIIYDYGDEEDIDARLAEIDAEFNSKQLTMTSDEHGEFDARHKPSINSRGIITSWWPVQDCDSCRELYDRYGLLELFDEQQDLKRMGKNLRKQLARYDDYSNSWEPLLEQINELAANLGLPNFVAAYDESEGFTGFLVGIGSVENFMIRDRPIFNASTYVEYQVSSATYYVVLDSNERIIAYYDGGVGWRLFSLGSAVLQDLTPETKVEARAGFSFDSQVPTTDIVIAPRDKSGGRHHFVVDDRGNVLVDEYHKGRNE